MDALPLYRSLSEHYREAIVSGSLPPGARFASVRALMARHTVSLSTALQVCRTLEAAGWLEARPRSGYFVRAVQRRSSLPLEEPRPDVLPDPAQYVGIHARVSAYIARGQAAAVSVNLSGARAAPALYPAAALSKAAMQVLRREPDVLVQSSPLGGNPAYRAVLARRALECGMTLSPEEILVTQGCVEALNFALRAVTQPGDVVAVESPSFFGLLQILEALGLRALEIPTSPQAGLSVEACELAFRTEPGIKAVVVVPCLQNPLGSIMPDDNKARLVALCAAQGVALIEDDTYSALVVQPAQRRALKSWDRAGGVIHCASLNKILAPGLRLGWITAGRWHARVEMLKYSQNRYNEALPQLTAADYMGSASYDRHLQRFRARLHEQRERTAEAVLRYFPSGTRLNVNTRGLALWIELPGGVSSDALFSSALQDGILIAPGLMFSNTLRYENFIRINCAQVFSPVLEQGLGRLGERVRQAVSA
jgi:DNA-binding transcriptional MocR family regulator